VGLNALSEMGDSTNIHTYTILTYTMEFRGKGNSEGSLNWKYNCMEATLLEYFPRDGFFFRGDRQECECTSKLMTLPTATESKIQDKH